MNKSKVMASHGQSINAEKAKTKADLDAKIAEVDSLNKQLKERDKDIKDLKKSSGDNEDLSKQLSDLQEKYKTDTANLNAQLSETKLNSAISEAMSGTKARNADVVKKCLIWMKYLSILRGSLWDWMSKFQDFKKQKPIYST